MFDVRDPRLYVLGGVARESIFTLTGNVDSILAPDPDRVAVLFGTAGLGANVRVSTNSNLGAQGGIQLVSGSGYTEFTTLRHPGLPQAQWYAFAAAGSVLTIIACMWYPWKMTLLQGEGDGLNEPFGSPARLAGIPDRSTSRSIRWYLDRSRRRAELLNRTGSANQPSNTSVR